MSFVNLQHSYSQITEVLGLGNLLTVPVPPQLGYFSTLKELSRLHRADVEDSLDWLQADVRSYEWTLVAEKEPYCRWGMRNCESMYWKFEGCRGESRARVQYWRCQLEEEDMIIIETEDHLWVLSSLCGEGEILSNILVVDNGGKRAGPFVHMIPYTVTVEGLLKVNRSASLETVFHV